MIGIQVSIDTRDAAEAMGRLTGAPRQEALESVGDMLKMVAKDNILRRTGPNGAWPSAGRQLFANVKIWKDISNDLSLTVTNNSVAVGSSRIEAIVRQLGTKGAGGTQPDIVPVKKKALTIPVSDAASRASYRGTPARVAFPNAFLLTKDGRHGASPLTLGVIARKVGGRMSKKTGQKENQKLEILYVLSRRVAIRPHAFLPVNAAGKLAPEAVAQKVDALILDKLTGKGVGNNG